MSGGHFNPIVSLVDAAFGGIAPASVPGFVVAQLAGGVAAYGFVRMLYPDITPADAAGVIAG